MASKVKALNHYRPMIQYGETAGWRDVAEYIARNSTVSTVDVIAVLEGLHGAIIEFNGQGRGVRLDGLGTYLPNINYQGEFDVAHRLDRRLKKALNAGNFSGKVTNRKHIGKTSGQVIALWNAEHPEDPVG
jgi:hypothetical protein